MSEKFKPTPPTGPEIDPLPETEQEEMIRLRALVAEAFAPAKYARAKLKHQKNISKALIFANALAKLFAEELS